jgi:hypothetical protein
LSRSLVFPSKLPSPASVTCAHSNAECV